MTFRTTFAVPPISVLAIVLALAFFAGACDDPPSAPQPSVNVDQKQKQLREKVKEVEAQAQERIDKIDRQLVDQDSGTQADAHLKE